jgi:hypothetical protein
MKNNHSKNLFNVHVKKIKIEIHPKMIIIWTYENMVDFKPFKSPILYIWCVYVAIVLYICLFLQVDNLNLATNLENYCLYAMLIAYKCMPLCKKPNCNTRSEPPYPT